MSLISITTPKLLRSSYARVIFFVFRECQTSTRGETSEKNQKLWFVVVITISGFSQENFFCCYSINIKELQNIKKIWDERLWSSGGESETEENNIKCNIFNEKWLIFLFDVPSDEQTNFEKLWGGFGNDVKVQDFFSKIKTLQKNHF